ncbi:hypothetical protein HHI36_002707 [Cryptolaemus montrouzieri]|uniref:Uncharacterized protein n=1 Tax=Cryptolaemus montrouzieri TaxID=559131 RepID=A0ABD2PB99_9CUCU
MTTEETVSQKYRRKLKENPEHHATQLQREKARDSKRREVMRMNRETNVDLKILARIITKERMQDDISRPMPGIKDLKTVMSNTGTKVRIQKRTMIMSIREAFEMLKETHPEISIEETVFYNERPDHILPIDDMNLFLAVSKQATDFPKTHQELLEHMSCSVDNEDCMSSSCNTCKESNIWNITLDSNPCVKCEAWIFQNLYAITRIELKANNV